MNNMFTGYVGLDSESKTLRFALEPVGETLEQLERNKAFAGDYARADAYKIVKKAFDRSHEKYINEVLKKLEEANSLDFMKAYTLVSSDTSNQNRNELEEEFARLRSQMALALQEETKYRSLFGDAPFRADSVLLEGATEVEKDAIRVFNGFSTYFTNFYSIRERLYTDGKTGTVAYRAVDENFCIFVQNCESFRKMRSVHPELIRTFLELWREGGQTVSFDGAEDYHNALTQSGIDLYNRFVGEYNTTANLYYQKNQKMLEKQDILSQRRKRTLLPLYKQILSETTKRYVVEAFQTDTELLEAMQSELSEIQQFDLKQQLQQFYTVFRECNREQVYFDKAELTNLSKCVFGNWNVLETLRRNQLYDRYSDSERSEASKDDKVNQAINLPRVSIRELDEAITWSQHRESENDDTLPALDVNKEVNIIERIITDLEHKCVSIDDSTKEYAAFIDGRDTSLSLRETDFTPMKQLLDNFNGLIRQLKMLKVKNIEPEECDMMVYRQLDALLEGLSNIERIYNMVRNYVTKKPFSTDKMHLKFDMPTLADGWSVDKEKANGCILLRRDGKYYLAVMNTRNKPSIVSTDTESMNSYEKMNYRLFKDVSRMIPKCSVSMREVKRVFVDGGTECILDGSRFIEPLRITKEIFDLGQETKIGKKMWQIDYLRKTGDVQGYKEAVNKWIQFCYEFLTKYVSTADYDYSSCLPLTQFESVAQFYDSVDKVLYRIDWKYIEKKEIEKLVSEGQLYLFQVYSQDYSDHKKPGSKKNLHTLYWEAAFSTVNKENRIVKLNGEAELFLRPASIKNKYMHRSGETLVNKRTIDGQPISGRLYQELVSYYNEKDVTLSKEAEELVGKVYTTTRPYDIVKDKRYTEDHYELHVPITINYNCKGNVRFNQQVQSTIRANTEVNTIGLDRGERNLITYCVVNKQGKILEQGTFNTIGNMDYQKKLVQREEERNESRKNWKKIENIKELKEGYISQVIHELTKLMVKHNAVIVMENLNFGFKKGRFKVEHQVYQKFEMALLKKLHYLVLDKSEEKQLEQGGVLAGYQLASIPESTKKVGNQCGFVFYVQPAYTSKIDPTTGFADVFDFGYITNTRTRKDFISRMDAIKFDSSLQAFAFGFDYRKFRCFQEFSRYEWTVYTVHDSVYWDNEAQKDTVINVTEKLSKLFSEKGIDYKSSDLQRRILEVPDDKANAEFWKALIRLFRLTIKLRYSVTNSMEDRIVSPVQNSKGCFFETPSRDGEENFEEKHRYDSCPMDADTNGAYHIARKGQIILKQIREAEETSNGGVSLDCLRVSNRDWFADMQSMKDKENG